MMISNRELLGVSIEQWDKLTLDDKLDMIRAYYDRKRLAVVLWTVGIIVAIWVVPMVFALMSGSKP
jgi:hypothetical protein